MDKIKWCSGKKEGLSLIESNSNLAEAYLKKAEEALESMRINVIKDWKISTAYYTIYFSLYSLLIKIGIKMRDSFLYNRIRKKISWRVFQRRRV